MGQAHEHTQVRQICRRIDIKNDALIIEIKRRRTKVSDNGRRTLIAPQNQKCVAAARRKTHWVPSLALVNRNDDVMPCQRFCQ